MKLLRTIFNCINYKNLKKKYRYLDECHALGILAASQLNSEKNKVKEPLENESALGNLLKCKDELYEVMNELTQKEMNPQRVLEEVGDAAAYLVGVIACMKNELNK